MYKSLALFGLLFGLLPVFLSCNNCGRIRCEGDGDYINVRLVRNGKNAVFGPDAFIAREDLRFYHPVAGYADINDSIEFIDSSQSVMLYVNPPFLQILRYPDGFDTITSTSIVTDMSDCCTSYRLSSVLWTGLKICTDDCSEIMEIEI